MRLSPLVALCVCLASGQAQAQVRGVYPLGISAVGAGGQPAPGVTYSNLFLLYARDQLRGPDGELVATGHNSVLMDMNTITWASGDTILGSARYSFAVTLPLANNSLTSDSDGAVSGGGGFADSYYQPAILGWTLTHADVKIAYGFLAPTGRFTADASDNVGSGYWTHVVSSGQTFYLSKNRATALSAFEMYEFHGTQRGTDIAPGQNIDLDYSLTHLATVREGMRLQFGVVGYAQWQTTDKRGPTVTPDDASARYRVHALGIASNLHLPDRRVILGIRYFDEFSARSTLQGYSLQISSTIAF